MVKKAQKDMEKMMGGKSVGVFRAVETARPQVMTGPPPKGTILKKNNNHVTTSKDVIRRDGAVTERETQRWEDSPAPGVRRHHHVVSESTKLKGHDGATVGSQERRQQESEASGGHEEILPDGTKRKVFTKSYETRQVFTSSSSHPKAL